MSAYQRLRRTPMLLWNGLSRPENIADSSYRMNHPLVFVQLAPQPMHEHIDNIGLWIEAVVENMFEDHRLGDGAAGVAHEVFQQRELARLQLDRLVGALHLSG